MAFLNQQVSSANQISPDCHLFNTCFYKKLGDIYKGNHKGALFAKFKKWWKHVDILCKAYILIPIHDNLQQYMRTRNFETGTYTNSQWEVSLFDENQHPPLGYQFLELVDPSPTHLLPEIFPPFPPHVLAHLGHSPKQKPY
ncbi:unnamed protein product [Arabidopsis thaliana]|uniref:Ubiquitin-like protease family profile domain-containing protein n=1 Tax=Arabidopsis thaliana TaxID=3702 RepID=A0A5S9WXM2_ARATH|nr:unnamed protein product [Arabidopsis thaliana]